MELGSDVFPVQYHLSTILRRHRNAVGLESALNLVWGRVIAKFKGLGIRPRTAEEANNQVWWRSLNCVQTMVLKISDIYFE